MIKLLVIADDFTGALDTGVQFIAENTQIKIYNIAEKNILTGLDPSVQVLVIDTETRHLLPTEAYTVIYDLVSQAKDAGIAHIYKKTDSALRGNIGSELTAMLDASGRKAIHFIPAFPRMGRTTRGGIQYIDGVPVAQSVFGSDPFEPVQKSRISDIIAAQSDAPTFQAGAEIPRRCPRGIVIYDAMTQQDMEAIGHGLHSRNVLRYVAGCAGFAGVLRQYINPAGESRPALALPPRMLTVCGSINPITQQQIDVAEQAGAIRIRLTPRQKLSTQWLDSEEGRQDLTGWLAQAEKTENLIIECGTGSVNEDDASAGTTDPSLLRQRIADNLGAILKRLLDMGLDRLLFVTGGDTLIAFLRQLNTDSLRLLGEILPGMILSELVYGGKTFYLVSKSGGFGSATAMVEMKRILNNSNGGKL